MDRPRRILQLAVLALTVTTAAVAAEPLRIGVSLGLTGKYAELGHMQKRAYELWRDEINAAEGLLGRPVEMVIVDDGSEPARAAAIYRDLIAERKVDHVFGPYSSPITAAVAPVAEEHGYPMLAAGASADEIWEQGYGHVFGMWTPASRYTHGMLEFALLNRLGRVAIVHADDRFSFSVGHGAKEQAEELGLDVVLYEEFRKGTENLTALAKKVRSSGADLLVVGGHFNEAVNMRRSLGKIGWQPTAFFATVGPALPKWKDEMGPLAEGAFATSIWEPHEKVDFPRSLEFADAFRERYKIAPSYHAATAYAAGQIFEIAVARADSLDRGDIRNALIELDAYSVIGRYVVDRTGRQVKRFPLTVQWQDGKKEIVWPEKVQSSPPKL